MTKHAPSLRCLLILSGVLFFASSAASAGSIDPPFLVKIAAAPPEQFLPAIVMMEEQVDLESLDAALLAERATRQRRHETVVNELKELSSRTQIEVAQLLDQGRARGDVEHYRAHWVANLFTISAKPAFITALSERFDVGIIYDDATVYLIQSTGAEPEAAGVEWDLRQIHADSLWDQGATGQGRLVCNLDTGVDGTHPSFSARWRGNDPGVTPQEAWFDPYNGTIFPVDDAGHGTLTMGLITGADHATGDTVGVAFGAKWIAANVFEDPITTSSAFMRAFEWTIDPDGDPSTIDDVPDVVSNSWGSSGPGCSEEYWRVIDANEVAGVAYIFASGNSGPGDYSTVSPGSRATTPLNTFAVGAVNSSELIASFSGRGPSPCDSLTIKPEVVAPGVSVRCPIPGGSYTFASGTSVSTPLVGGGIALLRQVSPNATVDEIKEVLLLTAKDLGPAGEDNDYGMGQIDLAVAARSLLPGSDDPYIVFSGSTVDDGNNGLPEHGETFDLILHLGNMGEDVTGLSAEIHSADSYVDIGSGSANFGDIAGGSVGDNAANPFTITLNDSTPGAHYLDFVLDVAGNGGAYTAQIAFSLLTPFQVSLADHDAGNVVFSVSDGGRFGFDNLDQTNGSGFIFPKGGNNWLFEGALLAGTDSEHLSHSARGGPGDPAETDWQVTPGGNIVIVEPGGIADEEGRSIYTDIGAPNPMDLSVLQRTYAFSASPHDDYVIVRLNITNLSPDTGAVLENLYVGLFKDWDISAPPPSTEYLNNEGAMVRSSDLGYMYREESPSYPHVGVSVLTEPGMTAFQVINNQDESYQFTRAEFYGTLSGGFQDTLRANGDYSFVIGTGPFTLAAGDTVQTAFAVLAGTDLADLLTNVDAARLEWAEILATGVDEPGGAGSSPLPRSFSLSQNYPNPFNPMTTIAFTVPGGDEEQAVSTLLSVYNMRGQRVRTLIDRAMKPGNYTVTWDGKNAAGLQVSSGIYLYTLEAGTERTSRKMVVLK
jgi:hypothetical protein